MKKMMLFLFVLLGILLSFSIGKKAIAKQIPMHVKDVIVHTVFITNDTNYPVRIYNEGIDSQEGMLVNPGKTWSGMNSRIIIYVPQKEGTYKLTPNDIHIEKQAVTLSQILDSLDKGTVDAYDIYVRTGRVKNFDVYFESLPVLTAD